jgi:hypothetical protein
MCQNLDLQFILFYCLFVQVFSSFYLLLFVFFGLVFYFLFAFFGLVFYFLFSFFDLVFYRPLFSLSFLSLFCPCFSAYVVSSLAYPNLLGTKMLGCCWCYKRADR